MYRMNVVLLLTIISSSLAEPNTNSIGGRILGGDDAKEGQFPYMVSIRSGFSLVHKCGGSIISHNVVLTAAQCVEQDDAVEVQVGSVKLDEGGDWYLVKDIIVHKEYDNRLNDIALLILADDIKLSDNVKIVNLREVDLDEKEECVLSGWGEIATQEVPNNLQFINLMTITREECTDKWNKFVPVYDNQTCTLTKVGQGACTGDYGNPLVDSEGNQIGIVSWGLFCANGMPDIYTRVASYIDWIKENGNLS